MNGPKSRPIWSFLLRHARQNAKSNFRWGVSSNTLSSSTSPVITAGGSPTFDAVYSTSSPAFEPPATRYPTLLIHLSFRFDFRAFFFSTVGGVDSLLCVRFVLRLLWEGVGGGVGRPPIRGGVQAGAGWVRQALPLDLGNFFLFFCLFFSLLACGCFDCGRLEICCFCCW